MRLLITGICFLIALNLWAQSPTTVNYYDSQWEVSSKEKASFYREVYLQSSGRASVKDYYIDGKLQMTGRYRSDALNVRHGDFVYYHVNGEVSSKGSFAGDHKTGPWQWFHPDASLKEKGSYDKRGLKTGTWRSWYENGKTDFEGSFKKDRRIGTWHWYHRSGELSAVEQYSDGKVTETMYYNALGVECSTIEGKDDHPQFKGGEDRLLRYIQTELKYPAEAKPDSTYGTVWVRFLVDEAGATTDVSIRESVHPLLDKEAMRVIKNMPNWQPGRKHGRATEYYLELPFHFTE